MAELKTQVNDASVVDFLNSIADTVRREDAFKLLELYTKTTGEKPKMWGPAIVGFGQYHYKSEKSAQEGEWMLTGFSPRKQNLSLYLMLGFTDYSDLLSVLGKHKTGLGCLYINKLSDINIDVLKKLITKSFQANKKQHSS